MPATSRFAHPHALVAVGFFIVLLIAAAVYWPGLGGGFLLDDYQNLHVLNDAAQGKVPWTDVIFSTNSGPLGRPVAMATFAANMFFNGPDVWSFKYTNLMLHLLCGTLIFLLSGRLFAIALPRSTEVHRWSLALLVAALWLLAPLLVSTTLYLVQRMAQLATLFCLAGSLSYVSGRTRLHDRPLSGWLLIGLAFVLWLPLAAFSKENGLLLPLLLLVIEVFFFGFRASRGHRTGLIVLFTISVGAPAAIGIGALIFAPHYITAGYAGRDFTFSQRIMTEPRVLLFYVQNLLFPQGDALGLFHDDFPVSRGLLDPPSTLAAIALWLVVLGLALFGRRRAWWPLLFGPCFFLAGQALESTVFPLELVFEHRNYLPAFGLVFSEVLGLSMLLEQPSLRRPLLILMFALPLVYAGATYQRANVWSSWGSILLSGEKAHPDSPRIHSELAGFYSEAGQLQPALNELKEVQRLRPDAASAVALHRLIVYCTVKRPAPADLYSKFPETMANSDAGIYTINTLRAVTRSFYTAQCPGDIDIDRLLPPLEQWAKNAGPGTDGGRLWDLNYEIAELARYAGDIPRAIRHLRAAYRLNRSRPEPLLVMARYQLDEHNIRGASATLATLHKLFAHPELGDAHLVGEYQRLLGIAKQEEEVSAHQRSAAGL